MAALAIERSRYRITRKVQPIFSQSSVIELTYAQKKKKNNKPSPAAAAQTAHQQATIAFQKCVRCINWKKKCCEEELKLPIYCGTC